jgi:hypothetical protein
VKVSNHEISATSWSKERIGFIIALPKGPILPTLVMESQFKGDLLECFNERSTSTASLPDHTISSDDWADVSVDTGGTPAVSITRQPRPVLEEQEVHAVPRIDILPRPDELLQKPPYHLTVSAGGTLVGLNRVAGGRQTFVEVQCSHSPSLQFLADYLKKWCRVNHHDSRQVKLFLPPFLYGRLTDVPSSLHALISSSTNLLSVWGLCMIG